MASRYKTVPVTPATWERLQAYKVGSASYDQVLNELMNAMPIEVVAERVVREHRERMATRRGRGWRAVRKSLGD